MFEILYKDNHDSKVPRRRNNSSFWKPSGARCVNVQQFSIETVSFRQEPWRRWGGFQHRCEVVGGRGHVYSISRGVQRTVNEFEQLY